MSSIESPKTESNDEEKIECRNVECIEATKESKSIAIQCPDIENELIHEVKENVLRPEVRKNGSRSILKKCMAIVILVIIAGYAKNNQNSACHSDIKIGNHFPILFDASQANYQEVKCDEILLAISKVMKEEFKTFKTKQTIIELFQQNRHYSDIPQTGMEVQYDIEQSHKRKEREHIQAVSKCGPESCQTRNFSEIMYINEGRPPVLSPPSYPISKPVHNSMRIRVRCACDYDDENCADLLHSTVHVGLFNETVDKSTALS